MAELIDTSQEEKKEKKADRRRERELSDIRRILQLPEGRRFLWRVLEKGRVFQDAYAGESIHGTNYNLGRQSVSRDFLNDILEADSRGLIQMQEEQKSEQKSEEVQEKIEKDASTDLT